MMESGTTNRLWPQRLRKRLSHRCPRRGVSQVGTTACSLRLATVKSSISAEYGDTNSVWGCGRTSPRQRTSRVHVSLARTKVRRLDRPHLAQEDDHWAGALLLSNCSVRVCVIFHGCAFFPLGDLSAEDLWRVLQRDAMVDGI